MRNSIKRLSILFLIFAMACGTAYEPKEEPKEEIPVSDATPPDQTLETVTWNLEWFGDGTYGNGEGRGPRNEFQQLKNILQVTDSLKADLYAFEEVHSQKALNDIASKMKGYSGFVADHINWIQKTAFVYNSETIDSLSAGAITNVRKEYQQDWDYYWANGRLPLYFEFDYTYKNTTKEFYAIVIHGKANTGSDKAAKEESYQRRKKAAEGLYYYLQDHKPNANIIILGDYNDDVDVSIYDDSSETPYQMFVANEDAFRVISKTLSESNQASTVGYPDMIDHITMSDELYPLYKDSSAAVFTAPEDFISNYGATTSDHFPVWAKFDVTRSQSKAYE